MTIDPYGDRAVYKQLSDLLAAGIRSGEYQPGTSIPSESVLMTRHNVARNTVRLAMGVLREQGLVVTRHGRGTFVYVPEPDPEPDDEPDDETNPEPDDEADKNTEEVDQPSTSRSRTENSSGLPA